MDGKLQNKIICGVRRGGPAGRAGILPGDALVSVNGKPVTDVFDYRYFIADADPVVVVERNGEELAFVLEKDEYEDPGMEFKNPLLAEELSCANKCVFCFIDQMPEGMRDTLYFKDDDLRLSFLTGNYVTLTNCPMAELKRLAGYHISPVNVSIHTMNPELRVKMLGHKGAGNIEEKLMVLLNAGITVNGQIVLVPGWNDGAELKYTLDRLLALPENFESVSVVPVGLTKFREGLAELKPFTKEGAAKTLDLIEDYRTMARITRGNSFVYASDEFYILAERPLPSEDQYDGFPSLEDGVGMLTLLEKEVNEYLEGPETAGRLKRKLWFKGKKITGTVATGEIARDKLAELAEKVSSFAKSCGKTVDIKTVAVKNDFFGQGVTVSGLITGRDLVSQIGDIGDNGGRVFITVNMLRSGENVFLDDMTVKEAEKKLGARIVSVGKSGADFVNALLLG
ncbi:MAG: DUF512 domain-containing protein [Clostridia bacterium]|nr:DUF512 domain-containing protein [Clostridia bacterium]